jgi:hypothetical protein
MVIDTLMNLEVKFFSPRAKFKMQPASLPGQGRASGRVNSPGLGLTLHQRPTDCSWHRDRGLSYHQMDICQTEAHAREWTVTDAVTLTLKVKDLLHSPDPNLFIILLSDTISFQFRILSFPSRYCAFCSLHDSTLQNEL